jgi:hypothetical protein
MARRRSAMSLDKLGTLLFALLLALSIGAATLLPV